MLFDCDRVVSKKYQYCLFQSGIYILAGSLTDLLTNLLTNCLTACVFDWLTDVFWFPVDGRFILLLWGMTQHKYISGQSSVEYTDEAVLVFVSGTKCLIDIANADGSSSHSFSMRLLLPHCICICIRDCDCDLYLWFVMYFGFHMNKCRSGL